MKDTSGLTSCNSLNPVDLKLYSGNKLLQQMSSDVSTRICKGCGTSKPIDQFRKHNKGGRRWTCRFCENKWVRTTKPWSSNARKSYQKSVRLNRRGLSLTSDAKQRAKSKRIPFDLDWRKIQKRIEFGKCELTGIQFDLTKPRAWNSPSIDRINSNLGYTMDNIRLVLYAVNVMAHNWGLEMISTIAAALKKGK